MMDIYQYKWFNQYCKLRKKSIKIKLNIDLQKFVKLVIKTI